MEKKVVIINDDLGTIALGFSKAGYEVGAIYVDQNEQSSVKIYQKNWSEQIFSVDWNVYPVHEIICADFYAGKIQFAGFSVGGIGRKQEYVSHNILKIVEILHIKRPSAFLFQYNKAIEKNELFKYFCEEAVNAGYQIKYNAVDINYLTGLPVKEKEYFIYGSLMQRDFSLELLKETYGINYSLEDICEKKHVEDEWYYRLSPRVRCDIEKDSFPALLCWKNDHYEKTKYAIWNPRMVPLIASNNEIRKITHREIARLKGVPDDYFLDVKNKSWLYQKLMFSSNVLAIQQIVSAFNYSLGERTIESREVTKGLEFETIVETYLKNKEVLLMNIDKEEYTCADFRFKIGTDIFSLTLKIYSSNEGIEKRVLAACSRFFIDEHLNNEKNILVVGNVVGNKTKQIAQEKYNVDVWDVENLLWLFGEFQQLKSDFVSILSFSVGELEPKEPKLRVFKQRSQRLYNTDLQEKLRKIKPGREESVKFEKLCVDILRYIFSDDLEFIGEQKESNDGLYRFDYCCKIKHGELKEFFDTIQKFFNTKYIIFEFKNYEDKITQKEIYTTEKYLYEKAFRKVAVIISRKGADINAQKAARGCLRENGKLIICLSDEDINKLIDIKSKSGIPGNELESILDNMLMELEK